VITLQLADLPVDADVANPQGRPLGSREQVAARMTELLPGAEFDEEGRGGFRRASYQIAFKITGDPVVSIGVAFESTDAFTALKRVVDKTGWCLIDPAAKGFVNVDASRAAARVVLVGEDHGFETPAAASPRRSRVSTSVLIGIVIGVAAVFGAWQSVKGRLPVHLPASILAGGGGPPGRLEKYADRVRRRDRAMAALPPGYRENTIVEQLVDVQMASRAYWNSVGDGRFSSPELLSNQAVWSRFHLQTYLPASFGQRQRDGYDFEFAGEQCEETEPGWPECKAFTVIARPLAQGGGPVFALFSADDRIHVRTDGRSPAIDDPTVDARPSTARR
jgi:hypothetical protein